MRHGLAFNAFGAVCGVWRGADLDRSGWRGDGGPDYSGMPKLVLGCAGEQLETRG